MSARKIDAGGSLNHHEVTVEARQTRLSLSQNSVILHKNGIEFRSPTSFNEWSEMTVALLSPRDGSRISCHGVIVGCAGNKHTGYHISMVFTGLSSETEKQLGTMARSEFGAG